MSVAPSPLVTCETSLYVNVSHGHWRQELALFHLVESFLKVTHRHMSQATRVLLQVIGTAAGT